MCRPNPGNYFPNTSAGGVAAGNTIWCPMGTFDRPVNQIGLTAGRNGIQYLVAFNAEGRLLGQVRWTPRSDSRFVGLETDEPIALFFYCNDDAMAGATISQGGSTVMSDTLIWGNTPTAASGPSTRTKTATTATGTTTTPAPTRVGACGNEHVDTNEARDDGNEVDPSGARTTVASPPAATASSATTYKPVRTARYAMTQPGR